MSSGTTAARQQRGTTAERCVAEWLQLLVLSSFLLHSLCLYHATPSRGSSSSRLCPLATTATTTLCTPQQVGHQAVECPNGTVNWKQIYGEEAFILRAPVYESQLREKRKLRTVDEEGLREKAEAFAKV